MIIQSPENLQVIRSVLSAEDAYEQGRMAFQTGARNRFFPGSTNAEWFRRGLEAAQAE